MTPERWQQLERLYHAASEREPHERASFLEAACEGDAELRLEVEKLLAANEQSGGLVDENVFEIKSLQASFDNETLLRVVGRYQVLSRLGAGGMGEVLLAVDTELGRRVALKMLPTQFTRNPDRLHRFTREARAASSLNHPNIVTIYEIGKSGDAHFIAMEYVEGETLRRRIASGKLAIGERIEIAAQICAALETAHKAGIVHRDIKPENVVVRPDGLVKVLDFGLAKLTDAYDSGDQGESAPSTQTGLVMGTPRYMSPEQARGQQVDARSDIFSLGVVLYEMVTGQMPFSGGSTADWLVALLEREPKPVAELVPEVSPDLQRVITRTLRKQREDRYQSCSELLADLRRLKEDSQFPTLPGGGSRAIHTGHNAAAATLLEGSLSVLRSRRWRIWAAVAFSALLLLAGRWWLGRGDRGGALLPTTLQTVQVASWRSAPSEGENLGVFSPDGNRIAFVSNKSGSNGIWVKQTKAKDAAESVPVTRDAFANDNPIWSPDGEEIAYTSIREDQFGLWRIPYLGGTPTLMAPLADRGAKPRFWSKDGATIYYESNRNLYALNLKSQTSRPLLSIDTSRVRPSAAIALSRDEQRIAFITTESDEQSCLWTIPVTGGAPAKAACHPRESRNPVWLPGETRILYSSEVEGSFQLFLAFLDGRPPVQLTQGGESKFALDISADGSRVLYGGTREEADLWQVGVEDARETTLTSEIEAELWPAASPDGKSLAYQFVRNLTQGDVIVGGSIVIRPFEAEASVPVVIPNAFLPVWSPGGKDIAFLRYEGTELTICTSNATGGPVRPLAARGVAMITNTVLPNNLVEEAHLSWAPDGASIVYPSVLRGVWNFRRVYLDGGEAPLTQHPEAGQFLSCPLWNQDGSRIAYASHAKRDGRWVYKLWVVDPTTRESRAVYESNAFSRLLGWSESGVELLLAVSAGQSLSIPPVDVRVLAVDVDAGRERAIAALPMAYAHNIHLSADRKMIAYASRAQGRDEILVLPVSGGTARKITANNDSRLYVSTLSWSPNRRAIYFSKHSRHSLLSMITNFK